ncbi:hypothetical protein BY996DRAFT_6409138 [Phakopsora pachyrhizi]|nr:hypothetical protein BY996DRAFT_6409138 [Phakopsora pachyrhizi]
MDQGSDGSLERPKKTPEDDILPATTPGCLETEKCQKGKIGTELKSMVWAPQESANVDSEELWISSIMGEAQFGMHGATAIGWMTLEGTKTAGRDLHLKTANILGFYRMMPKCAATLKSKGQASFRLFNS